MNHLLRFIRTFWPIGILIAVELFIAATNYRPGTYLMGWDNVMPEFNFRQAFITNLFGAWQEYRGVGLPDGMGHAANIVHTAIIWFMSLVLPQNTLRYAFHFLAHLSGMVGMYILGNHLLQRSKKAYTGSCTALIGALFYGLNLVTIQMFFTPLEAFSIHFAALPWLAYSLTRYIESPYRNTLFLFITVSILTMPQFFIPTLILPTTLLLTAVSIPYLKDWKRILVAIGAFLAVNACWMLPYIYHLPQNAPVIQSAKINEMSSDEVYARNRAFGDLEHVLTMRGFMLDFEDVDNTGVPIFVMDAWRAFTELPGMQITAWILAALSFLGFIQTLLFSRTHKGSYTYAVLYVVSIAFLATNTPVISDLMGYARDHIPLFREAYRFTFTKFGLLFGFSMSVLLIQGIRRIQETPVRQLMACVALVGTLGMSTPVFQGQFFYDALRIKLPTEYLQLFAFMDELDHTGRTAYLPIPSYWSWKHYKFGYVGSGFVWHGLAQPLMDRAFDPWSSTNETYYWELSRALYAKDTVGISEVFRKYDIRYIILDENLWAPGHDRSLFLDDIKTLLSSMPEVKPIGQTNAITVYEATANIHGFVRVSSALPMVYPAYRWTDNDTAYHMTGDYISTIHHDPSISSIFPFRSLFTKRAIDEREFTIDEDLTNITINSSILQDSSISATIDLTTPKYSARDDDALTGQAIEPCGVLNEGDVAAQTIEEKNIIALRLTSDRQRGCIQFTASDLSHSEGYLVRVSSRHIQGRPLMFSLISDTAKHVEIETLLQQETINLTPSSAKWQTDYFILPPLAEDGIGYSAYITNDAIGTEKTINDIADVQFYILPYNELALKATGVIPTSSTGIPSTIHTNHPNPAYYAISIEPAPHDQTLILSQAYNKNWRAYDVSNLPPFKQMFPWIFGTNISRHHMINNWENGWEIPNGISDVRILYIPQMFQFGGYIILAIPFLMHVRRRSRRADKPHFPAAHTVGKTD